MNVRDLATSMACSDIEKVFIEDTEDHILIESNDLWAWCSNDYKLYADFELYSWRIENRELHITIKQK